MKFISINKVRMHDTDMAGILYFARQFRFVHDALEDLFESEGYKFEDLFQDYNFIFVIVHAESDYIKPIKVGDKLEVHLSIEKMGDSSVILLYEIYRDGQELVGTAKTVHVCLERIARIKMSIPDDIRSRFTKYVVNKNSSC